ncbi:MAG TPA: hypothetical protein VGP93_03415, partial [Polyangiaceae bacterium]|nr:hypothetical protein [Polyangiaceae bacterium]
MQAIGLDPSTDGTLFLGTCNMGVWKTTDCGSSWNRINTGTNGDVIDQGAQTTMVVDPIDNKVIYTNSFYGQNGAFKSSDGGVNWQQFWPPADPELSNVVEYNFVSFVVMDPWDHDHLLVAFHASCAAPHSAACIGETKDGGESWHFIDGDPSWKGGEGQAVYFLDNSQTLLFGSESNGLWRTTNGGEAWQAIVGSQVSHGLGQLHRASNGTFYVGVADGIQRSADGSEWALIPNSGHGIPTAGLTGDGTNL